MIPPQPAEKLAWQNGDSHAIARTTCVYCTPGQAGRIPQLWARHAEQMLREHGLQGARQRRATQPHGHRTLNPSLTKPPVCLKGEGRIYFVKTKPHFSFFVFKNQTLPLKGPWVCNQQAEGYVTEFISTGPADPFSRKPTGCSF